MPQIRTMPEERQRLMEDRACVRYPCEIVFDSGPLEPGECAHPVAKGDRPEDGFAMYVHPFFLARLQAGCLDFIQLKGQHLGPPGRILLTLAQAGQITAQRQQKLVTLPVGLQ